MIVKLKGISRKGKNRVGNFGETWEVLREETGVMFDNLYGVWMLVRPTKLPNSDLRWVCKSNDKDFAVSIL